MRCGGGDHPQLDLVGSPKIALATALTMSMSKPSILPVSGLRDAEQLACRPRRRRPGGRVLRILRHRAAGRQRPGGAAHPAGRRTAGVGAVTAAPVAAGAGSPCRGWRWARGCGARRRPRVGVEPEPQPATAARARTGAARRRAAALIGTPPVAARCPSQRARGGQQAEQQPTRRPGQPAAGAARASAWPSAGARRAASRDCWSKASNGASALVRRRAPVARRDRLVPVAARRRACGQPRATLA